MRKSDDAGPAMESENPIHQQLLADDYQDPVDPDDGASQRSKSEDPSDPESTCPPADLLT